MARVTSKTSIGSRGSSESNWVVPYGIRRTLRPGFEPGWQYRLALYTGWVKNRGSNETER